MPDFKGKRVVNTTIEYYISSLGPQKRVLKQVPNKTTPKYNESTDNR